MILFIQAPLAYLFYYYILPLSSREQRQQRKGEANASITNNQKKAKITINDASAIQSDSTISRSRIVMGSSIALLVVASAPLLTILYFVPNNTNHELDGVEEDKVKNHNNWMTPFLLSTFGFSCFFKTIAVTFDLEPKGIEKQNFETFCTWFMSLPEPEVNIKDGSLINLKQGELLFSIL